MESVSDAAVVSELKQQTNATVPTFIQQFLENKFYGEYVWSDEFFELILKDDVCRELGFEIKPNTALSIGRTRFEDEWIEKIASDICHSIRMDESVTGKNWRARFARYVDSVFG